MGVISLFDFLNVILRVVLAMIFLFTATKVLTKRSLSKLTFFDYIAAATLGTIAGNLAFNVKIPIQIFLLSLILTTLIAVLASYLSLKYRPVRKLLAGEPTVLIQNGKILEQNMTGLKYSFDYLIQQLRQEKVFDIGQVEFAIMEPSGQLSIQLKSQHRPLTPQDLHLSTKYEGLATEVILDGKINEKNLQQIGLSLEWLYAELKKKGIENIEDVACAVLATNGNLYVDRYRD